MKRRKIILILLIFILMILSYNPNNFQISSPNLDELNPYSKIERIQLKSSNYWDLTYEIIIDNNWSDTKLMYNWCSGFGNSTDPYVIENITINGHNEGICIEIKNSADYFKIKNCSFYIYGDSYKINTAIKLYNTSNGEIIDNNCSININNGILLSTNCSNNRISNNFLNNNLYGIKITENCKDNIISKNVISNCYEAIVLGYSETNYNNIFIENELFNCTYGLHIQNSINSTVLNNKINLCDYYGISISSSKLNLISGNSINKTDSNVSSAIRLHNVNNTVVSENIMFYNHRWGINIGMCNNITIKQNIIAENKDSCFFISNSKFCNISNNEAIDTSTSGIVTNDGIWVRDSVNCTINENKISGFIFDGINLERSNDINITANILSDIHTNGIKLEANSSNIMIFNNIINKSEDIGIYLEDNCEDNRIFNNTIIGNQYSTHDYGVYLLQSNNNSIFQNYLDKTAFGIYLVRSNSNHVFKNTIKNYIECITEINCTNNIIENNFCEIYSNDDLGISGFNTLLLLVVISFLTAILIKKKLKNSLFSL